MSFRKSSTIPYLVGFLLVLGCSDGGGAKDNGGSQSGGTTSGGGSTGRGGTTGMGGAPGAGGLIGSGGASSAGGSIGTGGMVRSGGTTGTSTASSGGALGSGGAPGLGGNGKDAAAGTGGIARNDASPGSDGRPGPDGIATDDSGITCGTPMPTDGGKTYTGSNVNTTLDGIGYGIWTNGKGGSITVFPSHAFSASWSESQDFLAHAGLDYRTPKDHTELGTIVANYSEQKSGTAGGFSMIGMYGWTQSPCVEWYINEDSWNGLGARGNITATIDGGTYYLSTTTTNGTGGANACEKGHSGSWTQMISTRKGTRQCGTITVSDHFAAWEAQGWKLGGVTSIHINVEVGGGTGKIDFPVVNITTTGQ